VAPVTVPLEVYRGDSAHWTFALYTDAELTAPFDLTGAAAAAEVRPKTSGPVLTALVCTITLPNTVDVDLPAAASGLLTGKAVWDLQLTWLNGKVQTVVAGPVTVTEDVTDSTRP